MKKLLTILFCLFSISLTGCNFSEPVSYPDYPVVPQYLYGHWKMFISMRGLEDHSVPFEKRQALSYPDSAYLTLILNPDKTYQVILFDGQTKHTYNNSKTRWEIQQAQGETPRLVLYDPPNYMPGSYTSSDNPKEPQNVQLDIIAQGDEKGNVALWNGSLDTYDCFYRVKPNASE